MYSGGAGYSEGCVVAATLYISLKQRALKRYAEVAAWAAAVKEARGLYNSFGKKKR